ncbi:coiled-coil domain-containing protein 157 isoform X5 [Falco naumanni]|uniref:coiled-coil domain-containing protein 157 isoform X5 n=1 Tax=Falco naumanni TaxID=148594 RepID=UPI001ADE94E8|nr:coiled-coil domain-containing protein 157 isoform X5 [Falco naumanni]
MATPRERSLSLSPCVDESPPVFPAAEAEGSSGKRLLRDTPVPPACPFLDTQRASRLVLLLPTDTASSQERPCTLSLTASRCHGTSFSPKEREEAFLGLRVLPWDSPDGHHPKLWERAQQTSPRPCCVVQELLDVLRREKLNLEQSVSELQAKVSRLEEQTRGMQERERPLMFFPELHVPAEAQIESTGSLTKDMEKQIQANSIPVGVLEQNTRLRSALPKLKAAAERGVLKFIPQSQLLSQLSSQRSRQDAGRPSSQGGRDSTGPQGDADKAQQKLPVATVLPAASRLPSSRGLPMASGLPEAGAYGHSRQSPPASPGPCLSLLATGLVPRLCETGTERTCPPCSHHTYGHHK